MLNGGGQIPEQKVIFEKNIYSSNKRKLRHSTQNENYDCLTPIGGYTVYCASKHLQQRVLRCKKCVNCLRLKNYTIQTKLKEKMRQSIDNSHRIQLWTFGTNWFDTQENRKKLTQAFHKFRDYWRHQQKRNKKFLSIRFHFYVIEAGKSGFLHVHSILENFMPHRLARAKWSWITKKKDPNVNFSSKRRRESSIDRVVTYMAKYLTKSNMTRNYYFLGKTLKVKLLPYQAICKMKYLDGTYCEYYIVYYKMHDASKHRLYHRDYSDLNFCMMWCSTQIPKLERKYGGIVQSKLDYL